MDNRPSYDRRQLMAVASLVVLSPALRIFPLTSVKAAGAAAWLSVIFALPVLLLYFLMLSFLMRSGRGKNLGELFIESCGNIPGRVILSLFAMWFILYAGFTLRSGADRLVTTVYLKSQPGFFSVTMGFACIFGALFSVGSLVRFAKIVIPVVVGILLTVLGIGLFSVEAANLLPVSERDIVPGLIGALPVIDVLAFSAYMCCFLENRDCSSSPGRSRELTLWTLRECGLLLLLCVCIVGGFGAELTLRLSKPFFSLIRSLVFFRSVERIEAFVLMLWVFPDFLLVSLLLTCAVRCLRLVFGLPFDCDRASVLDMSGMGWAVIPCGAAAIALSLILWRNMESLALWSEFMIPGINLFFAFCVIPILAAAVWIKKASPDE